MPTENPDPAGDPRRPRPDDPGSLHDIVFTVERKTVRLALRENQRGRFLRITEDVGGRRDTVVVPAAGLATLARALAEIIRVDQASAPGRPPAAGPA